MEEIPVFQLAPIFQAAQAVMQKSRSAFNQADSLNGNHGDHMVEIFAVAVQAAQEKQAEGLAEAMDYAGALLRNLTENGSAQLYACGLTQLGEQFRKYNIALEELVPYMRNVLKDVKEPDQVRTPSRSGDILKALVSALAGWQQSESGKQAPANPLDLGYMFDLGIAYLQAKQRGGSRAEVIADAAATVSPLSQVQHRYQSGKEAILALLQAMLTQTD
jgi:hypothetical protein